MHSSACVDACTNRMHARCTYPCLFGAANGLAFGEVHFWHPCSGSRLQIVYPRLPPHVLFHSVLCRVEVAFDSTVWPDTTRLPCRPSEYELAVPSCDYVLSGWQTVPGDAYTLLLPTPENPDIAQCCPEGVVEFCDARITGSCNPRLSDNPWRLSFNRNDIEGGFTRVFFDLTTVPVLSSIAGGCESPGVDTIRLTMNPGMAQMQ